MRDIKFRAWDVESNEMTLPNDILEVLVSMKNEVYAMVKGRNETLGGINRDNTILMQYTGLKDRNGTEIYEGDVVEYYDSSIKSDVISPVSWRAPMFVVDSGLLYFKSKEANKVFDGRVIGNIFENRELLEESE